MPIHVIILTTVQSQRTRAIFGSALLVNSSFTNFIVRVMLWGYLRATYARKSPRRKQRIHIKMLTQG